MDKILLSPKIISNEKQTKNLSQNLEEEVKNFKPFLIKDVLLLSPGVWNDKIFSKESIIQGFYKTDWSNKENYALIYSHTELAENWVGNVINRQITEEGKLYGDLEIYDKDLAIKLGKGKAKLGISAKVAGDGTGPEFFIDSYKNFSVVYDPACREAFINLTEGGIVSSDTSKGNEVIESTVNEPIDYGEKEKLALITAMEKKRKELGMTVSEFYAAPRDPPSNSALPIFDVTHVRNALARFNQTHFINSEEKSKAKRKIITAAKKFNIEITKLEEDLKKLKKEDKKENMEKVNEVEASVKEEATTEELNSKITQILDTLMLLSEKVDKLEETKEEVVSEEEPVKEEPKEEIIEEPAKEEVSAVKELSEKLEKVNEQLAELSAKDKEPVSQTSFELSRESLGPGARNLSDFEMNLLNTLNNIK